MELQRYGVCRECGAGLIAVLIKGEEVAVCAKARLSHQGYRSPAALRADQARRSEMAENEKMRKTGELVVYQASGQVVELSPTLVRDLINPKATPQEAALFIHVCVAFQVNPFLQEAFLIKYDERQPAQIVIGKNAWLRRASEHPEFRGLRAGVVVMKEGVPVKREGTAVYPGDDLFGGWAEVERTDRALPFRTEVMFSEYNRNMALWKEKPATMIRKVALKQALAEAFPGLFQGYELRESERSSEEEVVLPLPDAASPAGPPAAEGSPVAPPAKPVVTDVTAFFTEAAKLGYTSRTGAADTKRVLGALGITDLDAWLASGRTLDQALEDLATLAGKEG